MAYQNLITIEKNHTLIKERKDGIIEIQYLSDFIYETKNIMQIHNSLFKISKHRQKKLLVLNIFKKYTTITADAKQYVSKGFHEKFVKAEAFVIQSLAQRLMTRYLINILKPSVKASYFADKIKAEKWLMECVTTTK